MSRAIWSGAISFGLVNVPIQLTSAIREQKIRFHLLSPDGQCRLRQRLYCPETGKEYDFKDTARGYEVAPEQYVIIDDDELEQLKPESGHVIRIGEFVKLEEIDLKYLDRTYYVEPGKGGDRSYRLLFQALEKTKRVGIGSFVMREREYLAAVRASEGVICLETMYYPEDIIKPEVGDVSTPDKRELSLAVELIDTWTTHFQPKKYHNTYREELQEVLEEKSAGRKTVTSKKSPPRTGKVVNLLDALKKSLREQGGTRRVRSEPRSEKGHADSPSGTAKGSGLQSLRAKSTRAKAAKPRTRSGERPTASRSRKSG